MKWSVRTAQKRLKRRASGLGGSPAWVRAKLAEGLNSCDSRSAMPESCHYVYEDVALVIATRFNMEWHRIAYFVPMVPLRIYSLTHYRYTGLFNAIAVSCSVECCIAVTFRFRCCCISVLFDGQLQRHATTSAANWDHDCNQINLMSPPITWNYCNNNRTDSHLQQ